MSESWISLLQSVIAFCADRLISEALINEKLAAMLARPDSPIDAVSFKFERPDPFSAITIGEMGVGEPSEVTTIDSIDKYGSSCRLRVWKKREPRGIGMADENLTLQLQNLAKAFWKSDLRNEKSWLISPDRSEQDFIDKSIEALLTDSGLVAQLYLDLDKFKMVNDAFDHDVGNRVIREFGAVLSDAVRPAGVVFHQSGDEFAVLCPAISATEVLKVAHRAMAAVSAHDFQVEDIVVGAKVGIALVDRHAYDGALQLGKVAEKAAKTGWDGDPNRGKTRFCAMVWPIYQNERAHVAISRDVAMCLVKGGARLVEPFGSPWLNLISARAYAAASCDIKTVGDAVRDVVAWIKPEIHNDLLVAAHLGQTLAEAFSNLDIAFAASHGLMRASMSRGTPISLKVHHAENFTNGQLILDNEVCVFAWGEVQATWKVYDLGQSFQVMCPEPVHGRLSRAILIQIGSNLVKIPDGIFSSVIVVDDRPTDGGGLPDFWEAAIARLVASVQSDPDVTDLFVLGDTDHAKQTVERLRSVNDWPKQGRRLAFKTGMEQEDIIDVSKRLNGHIQFPADDAALTGKCADLLRPAQTFIGSRTSPASGDRIKFLTFELGNEGFGLGREDGCRVATIAMAYPLVLEIVRRASAEETIIDEAGQELQELLDFKVSLTDPLRDPVPSFYDEDRRSMSDYFDREFVSPEGLFRKALMQNGQLDAVIDHVSDVLGKDRPFNTRRAVLVVPHVPVHGRDLHPLGLTSIRIVPRFRTTRTVLHYTFNWRTVEALVGFPYSLYGSVRFSEVLTSVIAERIQNDRRREVALGEVHYIAHSLHFFLDKYGQNIARRIVDDATF